MLSARKLHLLAGLKVDQTDLRTRELNFYMARFIAIASVSSIMTCLAYVGLIKIKIPVRASNPMACAYFSLTRRGHAGAGAQASRERGEPRRLVGGARPPPRAPRIGRAAPPPLTLALAALPGGVMTHPRAARAPPAKQVTMFYVSAGLTIAFSMFNLFLTSFMVVNAQGLSLRGPPGSVARCVEICKENW
eukprot:6968283-Prymnesium_polylepis.1